MNIPCSNMSQLYARESSINSTSKGDNVLNNQKPIDQCDTKGFATCQSCYIPARNRFATRYAFCKPLKITP